MLSLRCQSQRLGARGTGPLFCSAVGLLMLSISGAMLSCNTGSSGPVAAMAPAAAFEADAADGYTPGPSATSMVLMRAGYAPGLPRRVNPGSPAPRSVAAPGNLPPSNYMQCFHWRHDCPSLKRLAQANVQWQHLPCGEARALRGVPCGYCTALSEANP